MKKNWILLDSDGYGEAMWEENSHLYWCGGDTYAILWTRLAFNQPEQTSIAFYKNSEVLKYWKYENETYEKMRIF